MATQDYTNGTGKSLEDIAALMAANRAKMQEQKETRNAGRKPGIAASQQQAKTTQLGQVEDAEVIEEETPDEEVDNDEGEGGDGTEVDTPDTPDTEGEEGDDDGVDGEDEGAEGEGGEELEIDDDTLFEIEGADEPVSFKTLKEIFKADKELPKKMQAIEADYQAAAQTRSKAVMDGTKMGDAMKSLIQAVDQVLSQPVAPKPAEALKTSNPALYLKQLDAYNYDQQRIAGSRQAVLQALDAHNKQLKEVKENYKQEELNILLQKIPALKSEDPAVRTAASKDILDAAAFYGFTPEEIDEAADHRLFQMAHDAQQYRKLKSMTKEEKEQKAQALKTKISQQPKVLRSAGTRTKSATEIAQRKIKVLKSRAAATGRPEDVAAFMSATRQARA